MLWTLNFAIEIDETKILSAYRQIRNSNIWITFFFPDTYYTDFQQKIIMERYRKISQTLILHWVCYLKMTKTVRTEYLKDSKSLYLNGKHLKEIIIKNIAGTRKSLITTSPYYLVINSDNSLSTEKNNDGGSICWDENICTISHFPKKKLTFLTIL